MALNLDNARRKVESFMTEEAQVYAPDAIHRAAVDPLTLALTFPTSAKLYDGVCKIKDITSQSSRGGGATTGEGGQALLVVGTKIDFPIGDVPDAGFPEGALIVCTSALRMPQLVGAQYRARQAVLKTFGIQYSVMADRRKAVDPA